MKKRYLVAICVAVLLVISAIGLGIYSEYLEVREIGAEYTKVFFTDIWARFEIGGIIFAAIFAVSLLNFFAMRKNTQKIIGETSPVLKRKYIFMGSGVLGILASLAFSEGLYREYLLFKNAVDANITDPVFGLDISYFFFNREFLRSVAEGFVLVGVIFIFINVLLYFWTVTEGDLFLVKKAFANSPVFCHLAVNVIFLCVTGGLLCFFEAQGLLLDQSGVAPGAGYTDVHVRLPFYTYAPYILFIIAFLAAIFLFRKKYKATVVTILVVPVLWMGVGIYASALDALYVKPNEQTMEADYIRNNIEYTKIGYNLSSVTERTFPAEENLTRETLSEKADIINNIRITDTKATLEVLNSTKSIRNYYTFNDSDIVEYTINGKPTAVSIAVREMDVTKFDGNADNYINRTFKYTHGYGIAMNAVNSVNSEGQPDFVISDMPVVSTQGAPTVTQPRIYYGEKTNNYCIVDSKIDEFDYALNNENVEKNYEGTHSGIVLNPLNRMIFAVKNMDYNMLISGYINSGSRLLTNRNIIKRVKKAVPFMETDNDPYIVIDDNGKLFWVVDLYTTSNNMPYSKTTDGINYIRNSAKALVDAYEGDVKVYITDETDNIVMTYNKIYPSVMITGGLPEDIESHVRYPEYLFNIQSEIYLRYHMADPETFYSNSDLWMVAKEKYRGEESVNVEPYYNLLSVEDFGREGAQLVLMMPFVPANKENLVSWLAADSDGNLICYKFPSGRTVYGTLHIENRIDADADISKELSLWDQGGSTVLRGNVLVIPIGDSIIYVEPVYITTSNNAAVPEVKRVIVAYGDKVIMKPSLKECFDALFGQAEENTPEAPPKEDIQSAYTDATSVIEAYDKMHQAMQNGDWSAFGSAMNELDAAVDALR